MGRIVFFILMGSVFLSALPSISFSAVFEVMIYDYYFEPSSLTIHEGDTVVWINKGGVSHTSVSGTKCIPDGKWHSGYLLPEKMALQKPVYSHVFDRSGTYPYFCDQHCPQMEGVINVKP